MFSCNEFRLVVLFIQNKMDSAYYQVTSQLDAREILRYLNNLGIHNISGEVLKYFIADLKKLIKYDLEKRDSTPSANEREETPGLERLHSASTFSSRTRAKVNNGAIMSCTRECQRNRKVLAVRKFQSVPNLLHSDGDKQLRRACSCVRVEKKPESRAESSKERTATISSNNLIKVAKQPVIKKTDPVSLYHYYMSLWAKYKPNVPGENDWSDLRWSVRQKMAGCAVRQTSSKASDIQSQDNVGKISKNKL